MLNPKKKNKAFSVGNSNVTLKEYGNYAMSSSKLSDYSFKDPYGSQFNPPTYTSTNTLTSYGPTGATGSTGPAPVKPMTVKEKEKSIEDIASQIENTIADFIPESSKDLPVKIAKAVVAILFEEHFNSLMMPPSDYESMYLKAEQSVSDRIKNMTMDEYAKERSKFLGKHAGTVSAQMNLFDGVVPIENI